MNKQAINEVLSEYVVENANLKIMVKQLQYENEELKKDKEGESDVLKQEEDTSDIKKVE